MLRGTPPARRHFPPEARGGSSLDTLAAASTLREMGDDEMGLRGSCRGARCGRARESHSIIIYTASIISSCAIGTCPPRRLSRKNTPVLARPPPLRRSPCDVGRWGMSDGCSGEGARLPQLRLFSSPRRAFSALHPFACRNLGSGLSLSLELEIQHRPTTARSIAASIRARSCRARVWAGTASEANVGQRSTWTLLRLSFFLALGVISQPTSHSESRPRRATGRRHF
ncbi:hypothetical protein BC628DRAFT_269992 [Trametes gibbosa]|nr:hypothetical protein BC628DRAFT_269992 [Trametes gibbosa]